MSRKIHLPQPEIRPFDLENELIESADDFKFPFHLLGRDWEHLGTLFVRRGFVYDGGSVPRLAWTFLGVTPNTPSWMLAFFLHDLTYATELFPRSLCDELLYVVGRKCGNNLAQCYAVFEAVHLCGWNVWRKHNDRSINDARRHVELIPAYS